MHLAAETDCEISLVKKHGRRNYLPDPMRLLISQPCQETLNLDVCDLRIVPSRWNVAVVHEEKPQNIVVRLHCRFWRYPEQDPKHIFGEVLANPQSIEKCPGLVT